jgi:hypothetical protein
MCKTFMYFHTTCKHVNANIEKCKDLKDYMANGGERRCLGPPEGVYTTTTIPKGSKVPCPNPECVKKQTMATGQGDTAVTRTKERYTGPDA